MIRIWRLGYETWPCWTIHPAGWRHVFWRFFWFSPRVEREVLESYARIVGYTPYPGQTTAEIRKHLEQLWRGNLP